MNIVACPPDDQLAAFFAGEVSAAELDVVSAHLEGCSSCVARLDSLAPPVLGTPSKLPGDPHFQVAVSKLLEIGESEDRVRPGMVLRDYRILEKIGEGGMGSVFKAIHTRLDKTVAMKVIRPGTWADASTLARFEREMRAVGRVRDPHIVQATDAGEFDGIHYLVMEHVEGQNLSQHLKANGPMIPAKVFELIRQAARGLQHAHDAGLVHRDVKPSNLMLTPDGVLKILDLGLAVIADEAVVDSVASTTGGSGRTGTDMTSASRVLGTFAYMAPEQKQNAHAVDGRADVYGLGATMWFLLTGKSVPATWETLPELPGGLPREVWRRWLAQEPALRYATVTDAAQSLNPPHNRFRIRSLVAACIAPLILLTVWKAWMPADSPAMPVGEVVKAPPPGVLPFSPEQAVELQTAWAAYKQVPTRLDRGGHTFALIPPGEVQLGSQMSVTITKPYWLAICEVTHEQFAAFVEAKKYLTSAETNGQGGYLLTLQTATKHGALSPKKECTWKTPGHARLDPRQPVTQVSWQDAVAYCQWLSEAEGGRYRLPAEAEMIWANRAGNPTDDPVAVPKSEASLALGWHRWNADQPMPVGRFKANPWGLYDLFGNVTEHVRDCVAPRKVGHFTDYAGPEQGDEHFAYGYSYLAAGFKFHFTDKAPPTFAFSHIGFRILRELE